MVKTYRYKSARLAIFLNLEVNYSDATGDYDPYICFQFIWPLKQAKDECHSSKIKYINVSGRYSDPHCQQ